jgi:Putative transposase
VAEPRLSVTKSGNVRYELKTPYRNGTTHVIFEPLDFMAKLAALIPEPRVHLTRYHYSPTDAPPDQETSIAVQPLLQPNS